MIGSVRWLLLLAPLFWTMLSATTMANRPVSPVPCSPEFLQSSALELPNPQNTPVATPYDLQFIDALLDGSSTTLALSNLALQNTDSSDVWRVALRISESQAGALQFLHRWRSIWYPEAPRWISQVQPAIPVNAGEVCSSQEFDRQFLQRTIEHLQVLVEFATSASSHIEHAELQVFAESLVESESREMRSLQFLLDSIVTPNSTRHDIETAYDNVNLALSMKTDTV